MKITIVYGTQRRKPSPGDRRTTKKHGMQIRTWDRARNSRGEPVGHLVSNGRPMFSWTCPKDLAPWDRHWLTPEERKQFFPQEVA